MLGTVLSNHFPQTSHSYLPSHSELLTGVDTHGLKSTHAGHQPLSFSPAMQTLAPASGSTLLPVLFYQKIIVSYFLPDQHVRPDNSPLQPIPIIGVGAQYTILMSPKELSGWRHQ